MTDTKRVRFLETRDVGGGQMFEEGVAITLVARTADRWIRRGLAVEVTGDVAGTEETVEAVGESEIVEGFTPTEEGDETLPNFADPLEAKHLGFGKYDVLDANGLKVNTETLNKHAAEAVARAGVAGLAAETTEA